MNASGLVVRTWNDAPISRRDSDGYADATAMCQANGKHLPHYISNQRTTAYIAALGESLNLPTDQLVITTTSGLNHLRGTWVHPRLAVDLARWLSPQFAVWMDGWFLEQLEQPQPAPAPAVGGWQGNAWKVMNPDQWLDQPAQLRGAQTLVMAVETGDDKVARWIGGLFHEHGAAPWPISKKRIKTSHDLYRLPPSGRALVDALGGDETKDTGAVTLDLWKAMGERWSFHTICNRLSFMRKDGLVTKRGRRWVLTPKGQGVAAAAAA